MSNRRDHAVFAVVLLSLAMLLVIRSDWAVDEAKLAGVSAAHFRMADDRYFDEMDVGIDPPLSREEVIGRNMWMVWSGGNDRFWDKFGNLTFGSFDLLKILNSDPRGGIRRSNRWKDYGLVNEPCFKEATGPGPYGLWLDVRDPSCPPDPFAGVKIGERDRDLYGEPTGIVGLRLFPNPAFDAQARERWQNAQSYYCELVENDPVDVRMPTDPSPQKKARDVCKQANSKLIRPYRVGMTCAFCHVGPKPTRPPQDPTNPRWSELGAIAGAQFMNIRKVFLPELEDDSFLSQILATYKHGALDTSLVATDNINNPRTMNAIYELRTRMEIGRQLGKEKLAGGALDNKQINDFVKSGPLTKFFEPPDTAYVPHILKDGADSVGPLGALNRVHVNIGVFSEEWLTHFNALIGGKPTSPFEIKIAQANSVYWQITEANTINVAQYFLRIGKRDLLKDAPGGKRLIDAGAEAAERGKIAFATTCARCHSNKRPEAPPNIRNCREHKDHLACFKEWWNWTKTSEYKIEMTRIVQQPDFADNNYFSTDARIPVTLLRTNACSAVAPNATSGRVWDNFSSQTYKDLPAVGSVSVLDPFTGARGTFELPGGGRGYLRPPSLISAWATAPFLLNNSLGHTAASPSVEDRIAAFDEAIGQLLWPERRETDELLGRLNVEAGRIDRVTRPAWVTISSDYLPTYLKGASVAATSRAWLGKKYDVFFPKEGGIKLGPVPQDLPVNLIANADITPSWRLFKALFTLIPKIDEGAQKVTNDPTNEKRQLYDHYKSFAPTLLELSNCKDFEVNRGHYFGTAKFNEQDGLTDDEKSFGTEPVLSDEEKTALIAYLKTL